LREIDYAVSYYPAATTGSVPEGLEIGQSMFEYR